MVNKVILLGNVGQEPETKVLGEGDKTTQMSRFSLATSKSWKTKDGEKKEETSWHNIIVWRGLSKVVEKYVKKGDRLYIEGEVTYRSYENDKGEKKYVTEVVANELKMLSSKGGGGQNGAPAPTEGDAPQGEATDDLPF